MKQSIIKVISRLVAIVAIGLSLASCGNIVKTPEVKNYNIGNVSMNGTRSVDVVLNLEVNNENPFSIDIKDISGRLYLGELPVADITASDIELKRKSSQTYELNVSGTICDGVELSTILKLALEYTALGADQAKEKLMEDILVDVDAKAKAMGISKTYKYEKTKLKELLSDL